MFFFSNFVFVSRARNRREHWPHFSLPLFFRLQYEQDVLIDKINTTLEKFDADLRYLRHEKMHREVAVKCADLRWDPYDKCLVRAGLASGRAINNPIWLANRCLRRCLFRSFHRGKSFHRLQPRESALLTLSAVDKPLLLANRCLSR